LVRRKRFFARDAQETTLFCAASRLKSGAQKS